VSSSYFVKLEQFEGPLDLLLHLIREHQLNIFDIDLYKLTIQYIEYLRVMKFRDLSDAAAFMGMAAHLLEIKSESLLPKDEKKPREAGVEEEDPQKTLEYRLQQYDMFRRAGEHFAHVAEAGFKRVSNQEWARLGPMYEHVESPLKGDASHLVVLYEQMLAELADRKPSRVKAKTHRITVEQVILELREFINEARFCLFQGLYVKFPARYNFVAHILAALQLVRDGEMNLHQETMMGPIWLYRKDLPLEEIPTAEDSISFATNDSPQIHSNDIEPGMEQDVSREKQQEINQDKKQEEHFEDSI
jgi:segregation and condensation protein A